MNHSACARPVFIHLAFAVVAATHFSPRPAQAEDFSRRKDIEKIFRTASDATKLIRSLHYRMIIRTPELTKEVEFSMKDAKYRVVTPKFHVRIEEPLTKVKVEGRTVYLPPVNDERSVTYFANPEGPSPSPIGVPHQMQFAWLFDETTDCRWPLIQDHEIWKKTLAPMDLVPNLRDELLDGLPAQMVILYFSKIRYRLDVWFVESLGMYPMRIESIDHRGHVVTSSVVEKYQIVEVDGERTIVPTRIREMRTSAFSDDDPTYNTFEIVEGSLDVNCDLPDELFVPFDAPVAEIVKSKFEPIRDYRRAPPSEPEPIPMEIKIPTSTSVPTAPVASTFHAQIPTIVCLVTAMVACTGWSLKRFQTRT